MGDVPHNHCVISVAHCCFGVGDVCDSCVMFLCCADYRLE